MPFKLSDVVPWGRSYDEYVAMFALGREQLNSRILGCADGPAAFNARHTRQGGSIASVDPLYRFSLADIRARIDEARPAVLEQTRRNMSEFRWTSIISSVEELERIRTAAMDEFLADYVAGTNEGRYVDAELPSLPYHDRTFDLALCSHFLFLYSEHTSAAFHVESLVELCRVADEVRVFPVLELGGALSRHLPEVMGRLAELGYEARREQVPYEFQVGANEMLRVSAAHQ